MLPTSGLSLKKPAWVRVCGWLAWVCLITPFCMSWVEVILSMKFPRTVYPGLMLLAFFPLFILWCLGTVVHRVQLSQANLTAAALRKSALEENARAQAAGKVVAK